MKSFFHWILSLNFLVPFMLAAYQFDERIENISQYPPDAALDSTTKILSELVLLPPETELHYTRKILKTVKPFGGEIYLIALKCYTELVPGGNIELADSLLRFAKMNHLDNYLSTIYLVKAEIYRKRGRYDSVMVNTLKARENAKQMNDIEQMANVLHMLGDLYFRVRFYDKATGYYEQVRQVKGRESAWKNWRAFVIHNNMALIHQQQGNYKKALALFKQSRSVIPNRHLNRIDSLRLAYVSYKTGDLLFNLNKIPRALGYLDSAYHIYSRMQLKEKLFDVQLIQLEIYLKMDLLNQATQCISRMDSTFSFRDVISEEQIKYLKFKSQYFHKYGLVDSALAYMNRYELLSDSLNKRLTSEKMLQVYAENEFKRLNSNIVVIKQKGRLIAIVFFAVLLILAVVLLFYSKLLKVNKKLLEADFNAGLNLKLNNRMIQNGKKSPIILENGNESDDKKNQVNYADIIEKLNAHMREQKSYRRHDVSLSLIARELNTNRTYLSEAVNHQLGMHFTNYINSFRIKEVIRLLTDNKFDYLNLDGIAEKVGFNNRVTFINAFKKETGVSPSTFVKNIKQD